MNITTICAWCGSVLNPEGVVGCTTLVSHGICEACANRKLSEHGRQLGEFLESLAAPVVVIDSAFRVKGANKQAQVLTRALLPDGEENLLGDVFQCVHAMSGSNCGHDLHCSGCVISKTILETMATGRECIRVPASLKQQSDEESREVRFFITTSKVNDFIFLNIEEVELDG
ncbi:MAG TPA: hypothetical protein VIU41_06110 [Geobacteraceae bacterium]